MSVPASVLPPARSPAAEESEAAPGPESLKADRGPASLHPATAAVNAMLTAQTSRIGAATWQRMYAALYRANMARASLCPRQHLDKRPRFGVSGLRPVPVPAEGPLSVRMAPVIRMTVHSGHPGRFSANLTTRGSTLVRAESG